MDKGQDRTRVFLLCYLVKRNYSLFIIIYKKINDKTKPCPLVLLVHLMQEGVVSKRKG